MNDCGKACGGVGNGDGFKQTILKATKKPRKSTAV